MFPKLRWFRSTLTKSVGNTAKEEGKGVFHKMFIALEKIQEYSVKAITFGAALHLQGFLLRSRLNLSYYREFA